jgi:hypothetical protein
VRNRVTCATLTPAAVFAPLSPRARPAKSVRRDPGITILIEAVEVASVIPRDRPQISATSQQDVVIVWLDLRVICATNADQVKSR